ncbi:VOC family protein [Marinobacter mobilis]|uniref:Catechol 2,3-dioxygenase n=1 Tax=Marinobacter mobilis TaxID=488533 RepID=A0A1H2VFH8_9GAMM|nr:VOC family protein [Marinobacter mobilis]SDW67042.1 Catechol 2,3-dioxygenase [Marinobacter mobilis]
MSALTQGLQHVGLTVTRLEESASFFTQLLGWKEVSRKPDYPAVFVSDGSIMLTLWEAKSDQPAGFDRRTHVGLHHLALRVDDEKTLQEIHDRVADSGLNIEFPPEYVGEGPSRHMMCYEPSGIRVEFFFNGS